MKSTLLVIILTAITINVFAQKETFDAVSYNPIKGWKKERTDKFVRFSKIDEAKGTFCIISIYPSAGGGNASKSNFDTSWQKIVGEPLGAGEPGMEELKTENGWELQTGSAQFTKEGVTGIAMLVTASNNGTMVNMLVLFNSDVYAVQLQDFIGSIDLKKVSSSSSSNPSLAGIWRDNIPEAQGYVNGRPQYGAGYFRREYTFNSNGTYTFLYKAWSVNLKNILFVYETGSYTVNNNKLTISPASGKTEEWTKTSNGSTTEWGKRIKSENKKLQRTSYVFEVTKYYEQTSLGLYYDQPTGREANPVSNEAGGRNKASYSLSQSGTDISLPPGFRISITQSGLPIR